MYHLQILTFEKTVFTDSVYSTIAPGTEGYLEILAHHAPIIALLRSGRIEITTKNKEKKTYTIAGGMIEVSNNQAIIFADAIEHI